MKIQFMFVLTWLIPELKGLSRSEIESMVEIARQFSIPRIRKYSGYCFVASLFAPFIFFVSLFIKLGLVPSENHLVFIGMMGLIPMLSTLSGSLLTSIFNSLILKPAIYDQLNKKPRPPQASA